MSRADTKAKKVKCWEVFKCKEKKCPVYEAKELNCWLISGTHCRNIIHGKFIEKMEICLGCKVYKANIDIPSMKKTAKVLDKQFKNFRNIVRERDKELRNVSMELALSLSEVFEALKKISSGDLTVRIPETSEVELIEKLKHLINLTAKEIGEIVDQSHEIAIGLAEHFDVLHRVSRGELYTRASGGYQTELLESLKDVTNDMIDGISEKIAERMEAEEALRISEEKYRNLVDNALVGICKTNLKGDVLYVNEALLKIMEIDSPETITGKGVLSAYNNPSKRESLIEELRRNNRIKNYEVELLTDTGKIKKVLLNAILEGDTISGMVMDLTEHKKTEEALRESEKRFRAISNTAADAILLMNNEGKISYWNPTAEKIFGYTSEEAMGKDLHMFLAPERYHKDYRRGFSKFSNTGEGIAIGKTFEFFALKKDGTEFPIEVSTSAIQIKGMWHAIGIVRDVSERKLAEIALTMSEQKYRTLFEESKDVIFISTPDGTFLDINPAGIELFGYSSREEMLAIDIARDLYVNSDDRKTCLRIIEEQGYVKDYEVELKRKDGKHVIALMSNGTVRDNKGEIIAYRGIIKDITERKRLEQQLLQAQKMEAIGQLAGGIAHDFNNILTAIIGYGNIIKMQIDKDTSLSAYMTYILDSAERAAKLTQDLLAFGRRQMIRPNPANLNEIIKGVEKILLRLIGEDIELSIFLSEKDLTIMADSTQIEQVLMNLATNARDAMPEGGSLIITTDIVEIDERFIKVYNYGKAGKFVLITVSDTGIGMDEQTKSRIFEPFFTTKEIGKGTGLGLAMSYGIVKQHYGFINVYSEPQKGSAFKIYLPLINVGSVKVKERELVTTQKGTETILLAEDDMLVRQFLRDVLEGAGYTILEAADGEDAIKVFNEGKDKIRMLILDVIMPKKNGKEVYEAIKKTSPHIKAIFTSGYSADIIYKKGVLERGLEVIPKPVSSDTLLIKIRELLDR